MKIRDKKKELSIYITSKETKGNVPLYKALIDQFISMGITGCTVLKSTSGYGTDLKVKYPDESIADLWSKDSTIVLQVIESASRIEEIVKMLDTMMPQGVVTIKDVDFIRYTRSVVTEEDIRLADKA
ncbi:MAG TPA: DUF190 domain-containing protein [Leptospiraceae bacterium]|nr:DUF190 domain-containing protein [Leptospiraceae bacterium]HMW04717.1 DUF190 domain-containing protein [Leptospiraceae bacterium]HMX31748.1 DUF190 domain-containing protein [Leptospiraceae bacterium]HMY30554.1 DUF190 domain-containing protein [Leptospiraceae bacterium]HMZ64145.1 DUF190 domain-containing protein [Leptospiraceae bacterium]